MRFNRTKSKLHVLCIDDNEDFLQVLRHLIEAMGYDLTTTSMAEHGVEIVKTIRPAIIFCDLGLPGGMDGFQFASKIRSENTLNNIPMIAISARTDEASIQQALLCGFDKIFSKPVKFADIRAALLTATNLDTANPDTASPGTTNRETTNNSNK